MKPRVIFTLFLFVNLYSFSQETPKVIIQEDSSQLRLTHLKINVEITGNSATTTYDMKFYNGLDRTLEGELVFPLGEGQAVSRFAMDVNGKLREAVIVEKELARVAYENTIRQKIDPGLLEKTQGNNYKARVYPILPNNYKHIVITYEQELFTYNKLQMYELPLGIMEALDEFSLRIDVFGGERLPIIEKNNYQNLFFKEHNTNFYAEWVAQNYTPKEPIIIKIPHTSEKEEVLTYNDYFYVYKTLEPNSRLKSKPKKITLLWDASYSVRNRNLEEELKLLDNYFSYLRNIEVQFISFSNTIHTHTVFKINNGNWESLKEHIKHTDYDGGTCLNLFDGLNIKQDEILLFTDGLANLGDFTGRNEGAVYTINSTVSANHEMLNRIATNSGGNYINLVRLSHVEALKILKQETFQFLGATHRESIQEVYPYKNIPVSEDFSISGRFSGNTTIELLFGYQGKVTQRLRIPIKKSQETALVKRLWAKQKLEFLNENKEQNRDIIISLAKQYHLVTDYTSMLILDRIEDYVRYRIDPPGELREEYKQRIADIEEEEAYRLEELKERKEELLEDYKDIRDWYNTRYPKKEKKPAVHTANQNTTQPGNNQTTPQPVRTVTPNRQNTGVSETSRVVAINSTKRIISGTITDQEGTPLPGVNIIVKETSRGTQTDFDGNFVINAEENEILIFSYIGQKSVEQAVEASDTINIRMEEDSQMLESVVATALAIKREPRLLGYAISEVSDILSGKASGLAVNEQPGASSSVTVRGNASVSNSAEPLYIIDGVVATGNPMAELKPGDIESIEILKADDAIKLYGSRAANGLVSITTLNGKEANKEAIEELNKQIDEKIELKSWNPDTPYIRILEKESTAETAYKKYLEIRNEYSNSPSFYLDVADFFDRKQRPEIAITVLTNLLEIELDNYELLKALAYKLDYFEQSELAVIVYKKVLELRPEEPQSYRDLALAYEAAGEYQKSFDLLYKIYQGELLEKDEEERYYGIEQLAYVELSRLVAKYGKKLKLSKARRNNFSPIPVDIRIVIDWNHNDTDMDLWVTDPNEEKAYYKNVETKIGGRMSEDMADGYGPEEFMLKNAIKGTYKVMVDYYSDDVQKISGPTILKVTLFTHYGKENETKKTIIIRLDKEEDEIEVANLKF